MKKFYYLKQNSLINKDLINKLLIEINKIFQIKKTSINSSDYFYLKKSDFMNNFAFINTLNIVNQNFIKITGFDKLELNKLKFFNTTAINVKKDEVPYVPHIDKKRFFKAMVYLHDVSLNHGPIHIGKVKNNSIDLEKIRINLPSDYKEKKLNIIDHQYLDGDLTPMIGKAGDVIFFDTNTPHKAGVINSKYSRKVLRFDFINK